MNSGCDLCMKCFLGNKDEKRVAKIKKRGLPNGKPRNLYSGLFIDLPNPYFVLNSDS